MCYHALRGKIMSVLIIGSGLIGTQIAKIEVDLGERPIVMELSPQLEAIGRLVDLDKIEVRTGDVLDFAGLSAVIKEYSVKKIIHTVANPLLGVGAQAHPHEAIRLNVMGTANVLEAARELDLDRVVFCSSSVLYSYVKDPKDTWNHLTSKSYTEEMHPRPSTIYATTKQAAENLGLNYAQAYNLDFVAVRYAATFGPWTGTGGGGEPTQMVRRMIEKALIGEQAFYRNVPVELVYSKDAALGAVKACHAEKLKDRVFNISSGLITKPEEIVSHIQRLIPGAKLEKEEQEAAYFAGSQIPMDISRAKEQLGFEPQFSLEEALEDYLALIR